MLEKPMGGTELMYEELMSRISDKMKEKVSIFNYVSQADFNKPTIFWNQLSYDQQAVQLLSNPENLDAFSQFVFVSHWQADKYRKMFNIPGYKTKVIKNACIGVEPRKPGKREKVKLCYISTPWRGLDVLLAAWEMLNPQDCELHVFSSTKIYGKDFAISQAGNFQDIFDKCEQLEGVVYREYATNEELRKELPSFDILAYPNTFEETSCIAVIEALSAGLRVITSNLGALPETTEGWARMYPFYNDKQVHAMVFSQILQEEINKIKSGELDEELQEQVRVYAPRWSWNKRIEEWNHYLDMLIQQPQLTSEQTLETSQSGSETELQTVGL